MRRALLAHSHLTGSSARVFRTAPHAYVATVSIGFESRQSKDGVVSFSAMDTDDDFGVCVTVKKERKAPRLRQDASMLLLLHTDMDHKTLSEGQYQFM